MKVREIRRFSSAKSGICNDRFLITTTGRTVAVYDTQSLEELASFKGMTYSYQLAFRPGQNAFALKSSNGILFFYDLDKMQLIRKLRVYTASVAQDNGFCYSKDGSAFYNIVSTKELLTYLVRYDADTLEETARWFTKDKYVVYDMQYVDKHGKYVLQGYERLNNQSNNRDFLLWFDESASSFSRIDLAYDAMDILWMRYSPEQDALMAFSPLGCSVALHETDGTLRNTLLLRTEKTKLCTIRESFGEMMMSRLSFKEGAEDKVVVEAEEMLSKACFTENGKHIIAAKCNGVWIFESETMQCHHHIPIQYATDVITEGNRLYVFTRTGGFAYEVEW